MFLGIDVGSLTTKSVLINQEAIISSSLVKTGANPQKAAKALLDNAFGQAEIHRETITSIVATGYGRVSLPFAHKTVTELTCHARGVRYLLPEAEALIDIGGQDSKAILLNRDGTIVDFAMNDRCAAGTGRFLELMARVLELDMETMARLAISSRSPCPITSTCSVFAESEVVSLLASGRTKEDITGGLHRSIARRVGTMANRIGINRSCVFVGGVAKNIGVRTALEEFLKLQFIPITEDPQLTGALGAALFAREQTQ